MARTLKSILADTKRRMAIIEQVREEQLYYIRRNIEDMEALTEEIGQCKLEFDDEELSVSWYGGVLPFRKTGYLQYYTFKTIYDSGEEGVSHAELAEAIYGNDLKNISWCIQRLVRKLAKHKCPYRIESDNTKYWVEAI